MPRDGRPSRRPWRQQRTAGGRPRPPPGRGGEEKRKKASKPLGGGFGYDIKGRGQAGGRERSCCFSRLRSCVSRGLFFSRRAWTLAARTEAVARRAGGSWSVWPPCRATRRKERGREGGRAGVSQRAVREHRTARRPPSFPIPRAGTKKGLSPLSAGRRARALARVRPEDTTEVASVGGLPTVTRLALPRAASTCDTSCGAAAERRGHIRRRDRGFPLGKGRRGHEVKKKEQRKEEGEPC